MTHEAMIELAHGYFDAVCAADAGRLRELFTEDVRWRIPKGAIEPYGGMHEGADKIVEMMLGAVGQSFVPGSQRFEILTTLVGEVGEVGEVSDVGGVGDVGAGGEASKASQGVVCCETEMTARAPDGRRYQNDYTFFFELRDGRISEIREHVDTRYAAGFFAPPPST